MTKSEFTERLVQRLLQYTHKDVAVIVDALLAGITETLAKGGRLEVRDFGIFSVHLRQGRKGRNPNTGQEVVVPDKQIVRFQAGRKLRSRVNFGLADAPKRNAPASPRKVSRGNNPTETAGITTGRNSD